MYFDAENFWNLFLYLQLTMVMMIIITGLLVFVGDIVMYLIDDYSNPGKGDLPILKTILSKKAYNKFMNFMCRGGRKIDGSEE